MFVRISSNYPFEGKVCLELIREGVVEKLYVFLREAVSYEMIV